MKVYFKERFELLDDNLYCQSFPRKVRSDVVSGWAGWALVHPEFESSVNPIPTREESRLCPPHCCLPTRILKPNGISLIRNLALNSMLPLMCIFPTRLEVHLEDMF